MVPRFSDKLPLGWICSIRLMARGTERRAVALSIGTAFGLWKNMVISTPSDLQKAAGEMCSFFDIELYSF